MAKFELNAEVFSAFDKKWALLASGTLGDCNAMTVSWGGFGTIWNKPVVTVYVRTNRHTYGFMEKNELFTLSFYPESMRPALKVMGTVSGRDGDKFAKAGLVPVALDGAVTFEGAERTLVLRRLYRQEMDMAAMPECAAPFYAKDPVHVMYIGEVVDILG